MRVIALLIAGLIVVPAIASEPGQPLDCSDWVILEPGYACVRLFGGTGTQSPGSLMPVQFDNTGRVFRFGPDEIIGVCGPAQNDFVIRRHPIEWWNGDVWQLFAYVDDRCVTPTYPTHGDALRPGGPNDSGLPFHPALAFDPANGRMLLSLISSCEGGDCSSYPPGTGDYWVASISGFATTFDILQTFTPTANALGFRVPYMPEGMPAADHFDTYYGPLTQPIDFSQARGLSCDFPTAMPAVGDYLEVADTLPAPAPGTGRYYVTAATNQGKTRYGRKTTNRVMSGRDPALLPSCAN